MLLDHSRAGGSFEAFAALIGVSIETVYKWSDLRRGGHQEFAEARKQGYALALKWWEDTLRSAIFTDSKTKANIAAIIFSMKNRFWRQYGETTDTGEKLVPFTIVQPSKAKEHVLTIESDEDKK